MTVTRSIPPTNPPPPDGIPSDVLSAAVDRIAAELCTWLPADVAMERSRNIVQGLSFCDAPAQTVITAALRHVMSAHPFGDRVLAASRTSDIWLGALTEARAA